jgi:hypothetical protein
VEKVRGQNGVAVYDPNTGKWTFFNGFDIPRDPRYKDGMTIAPNINNSPTIMPGNMMGALPEQSKPMGNLLAELPWAPPVSSYQFAVFAAFLLTAALFIRGSKKPKGRKSGSKN